MKKIFSLFLVILCVLGLSACSTQNDDVLHLGVNAIIEEINIDKNQLVVSGIDNNSFLGNKCEILCDNVDVIYCNYESGEVSQISIQDLQVGDEVILAILQSEVKKYVDYQGTLKIEQLQLGTQRLN